MASNSSLRDLILITYEEYNSLERQAKTPFETVEVEEHFKTFNTAKQLPEDTLVAHLNLKSR